MENKEIFLDLTKTKNLINYTVNSNNRLILHVLDIFNANTKNEINIKLKKGAQVNVLLSSFAKPKLNKFFNFNFEHLEDDAESSFDSYLVATHLASINVKIVSIIKPKTTNNKTSQKIKGVLLSNSSTIHGEPQLIIDDNNVKAKHAMAVGQIDPKQIFYLMSRGIKKSQAIQLILMGFFKTTLKIINDEKLMLNYLKKIQNLFKER
ncbi:SufD family Fe-S cluster assembly protein [Mycoplasmoides alvi]|uniref:SufD family Fe-S cluster assembly protein n=1 Tax=Mycoplasmoides alvi TaxID=78580 RepID=UPI00051BC243|nr:SufD family Fe-S cluster assembly protein [Mycoplasmoides alvi]